MKTSSGNGRVTFERNNAAAAGAACSETYSSAVITLWLLSLQSYKCAIYILLFHQL